MLRAPAYKAGHLGWFLALERDMPVAHCVLYFEARRRLLKIIDFIASPDNPESAIQVMRSITAYAISLRADGVVTNVSSPHLAKLLKQAGYFERHRVRCTYFPLQPFAPIPASATDDHFWIQTPIDRDNFHY